ncbi:unnamed protein product [Leptosia nina]|uniref:FP protein C-terminal domain-containing protein n=1 Tax=Leptosia nina TaxID=320188 RepID=A0AAV1J274_9NEOP
MPLKRTPPSTPTIKVMDTDTPVPTPTTSESEITFPFLRQNLHHCTSEPTLARKTSTSARKRKHADCDDDKLSLFMAELKDMIKEQNNRLDKVCSTVEDMRASFEFLAEKYEVMLNRINTLESDRLADAKYIKSLESKLESSERSARASCLEIRNIPKQPTENKVSLLDTFVKTAQVLKVHVERHEVKDIFRVKSKDLQSTTVIVDLTSCLLKEKIIKSFRSFNKGSSKLSTEHINIKGDTRRIFVSENLTASMKRLFFLSRELAKSINFKFCWTSHGKIFMRKKENSPLLQIYSEADINKVREDNK